MTDDELRIEQARGRGVGLASVLTVAMFSAFIITSWLALRDASGGGNARRLIAIHEHKLPYVLSSFFLAVGSLLVAAMLAHIILAARSRSALVPKVALFATIAGPVLAAVVFPAFTLAQVSAAADFAAGAAHGEALARDLLGSTAIQVTTFLYMFAQAVVASAWVMTGIYGMRIGLLTRLVGSVAIAIGIANVIAPPFAALLSVFWIGAMAITLLGESAQTPPAWKLGRSVPWREVAAIAAAQGEDPADFEKPAQ
jgi:hypothetical protein